MPFFESSNMIEILSAALIVVAVLILIGVVVMVVLAVTFYRLKVIGRRRERERELQWNLILGENRDRVDEASAAVETNHSRASLHKGEGPPRYEEAITSSAYTSISLVSESQESVKECTTSDSETTVTERQRRNDTGQTSWYKDEEFLPPPYVSNA